VSFLMIQSKKNSLKHLYGLMGLETNRGWNGNVFLRKGEANFPKNVWLTSPGSNQWTKEASKKKLAPFRKKEWTKSMRV